MNANQKRVLTLYRDTKGFLCAYCQAGNYKLAFFLNILKPFLSLADKCGNTCRKNFKCTVTYDEFGGKDPYCICKNGFADPTCSTRK